MVVSFAATEAEMRSKSFLLHRLANITNDEALLYNGAKVIYDLEVCAERASKTIVGQGNMTLTQHFFSKNNIAINPNQYCLVSNRSGEKYPVEFIKVIKADPVDWAKDEQKRRKRNRKNFAVPPPPSPAPERTKVLKKALFPHVEFRQVERKLAYVDTKESCRHKW